MAVSVGRLFQSSVTWGDKDILRWSVLQYGVGVLEWLVMSWVSFWLAWSAGAVLCVDRDEVMVEFREVNSVFSSAFLEGLPVKGSDHQVHT